MRAVAQRVLSTEVIVDERVVGAIGHGLLVYLGVSSNDDGSDVDYIASKLAGLRIFEGEDGKMTHDVLAAKGAALVVPQFTLFGDVRKGRRPSFSSAARPELANTLFESLKLQLAGRGVPVESGVFGADMAVRSVVDGPITILIDSKKVF